MPSDYDHEKALAVLECYDTGASQCPHDIAATIRAAVERVEHEQSVSDKLNHQRLAAERAGAAHYEALVKMQVRAEDAERALDSSLAREAGYREQRDEARAERDRLRAVLAACVHEMKFAQKFLGWRERMAEPGRVLYAEALNAAEDALRDVNGGGS
jgi:septal ring factor EnvC (AmiA/AmiB activator)